MKHSAPKPAREAKQTSLLYGYHAVAQAWLNPERNCRALYLTEAGELGMREVLAAAKAQKLQRPSVQRVDRDRMEQMLPGAVHQGIALDASPLEELSLAEVLLPLEDAAQACVVVLDQVTDPHNVGAIMRSAAAFGAAAVIMPDRNAPPLSGVLAKTACGAVDAIPLVRVGNISRALDELKSANFWTVGFAEEATQTLAQADLTGRIALVMGAEGDGLRRLTGERCDLMVRLPTVPPIGSLNVSNAAAVALYEVARRKDG
jgi:23S rRNA (guanosine2251-2'-O)-methyltransferase